MGPYNYDHLIPPPKSKTPFYNNSPHWNDITPVPLLEGNPSLPDPGPALATIAYSPRYTEAMSYLRAVMAKNEASERVLALTEDVIGMNPAHYTVWGFRMRSLRKLWGVEVAEGEKGLEEEEREIRAREGVERELEWLEGVSERNLKNYQIWHHRQSLLSLLPLPTTPQQYLQTSAFLQSVEIPFLSHILSFDAKNYHVWTYRQWLCRRYPEFLLEPLSTSREGKKGDENDEDQSRGIDTSERDAKREGGKGESKSSELIAIEALLEEDMRNNSAWSHRYFITFGHEELVLLESDFNLDPANPSPLIRKDLFCQRNEGSRSNEEGNLIEVEDEVRDREIGFVKGMIERAPMNASAWNYLKGLVRRCDIPKQEMREFCESFVRAPRDTDLFVASSGGDGTGEQPESQAEDEASKARTELDFEADTIRSSHAIAYLAEIYSQDGKEEGKEKARRCWHSLAQKWDPIRKNYWEWRVKGMEEGKFGVGMP